MLDWISSTQFSMFTNILFYREISSDYFKYFLQSTHSLIRALNMKFLHYPVPSKSDILKEANKMALLPLMQVRLPKEGDGSRKACQVRCFVYSFINF